MDKEKQKKNRDKILEIIDKYDKKSQDQLSISNENIELKNQYKILFNQKSELERELKKKDLIIEKKNEIIDNQSRKITDLTNQIIILEKKIGALEEREKALLADLSIFMKDVNDKPDIEKLKEEKFKILPTDEQIKTKSETVYKIKLVMLGEYAVGKTSFIRQFTKKRFTGQYKPTIGAEITKMRLRFRNNIVDLMIWDVAGQIAFKSMADRFIQGANMAILIYDVTRPETFKLIKDWYKQILTVLGKKIPCLLVGNKIDLINDKKVKSDEGQELAQEIDSDFIEISVKTNTNIKEALILLISKYIDTE
ncbi:MAG: GTP-binding protein [Candidatus Helarchaeota archaeon]